MKNLAFLLVALFWLPAPARAELENYLVFARDGIQGQQSDFQGRTGSLGSISLAHFEIVGDLVAGESIRISDASVRGTLRAPYVQATRVGGYRALRRDSGATASLARAAAELNSVAQRLSSYAATTQAVEATDSVYACDSTRGSRRGERGVNYCSLTSREVRGWKISATRAVEVVDLDAANLTGGALILEGGGQSSLLIRVRGDSVDFRRVGIFLRGGLTASQVVFYFPEARSLNLSDSGGAVDPATGAMLGIPGSVVAPHATVEFADVLVTGQVLVANLCTERGRRTGQVNFALADLLKPIGCLRCGGEGGR